MPDIPIKSVKVDDTRLVIELMDGCVISTSLLRYPRLAGATAEQRNRWEIAGGGHGIHWPEINEDLSVKGLRPRAPPPRFRT